MEKWIYDNSDILKQIYVENAVGAISNNGYVSFAQLGQTVLHRFGPLSTGLF